jgi:hypothetical protein
MQPFQQRLVAFGLALRENPSHALGDALGIEGVAGAVDVQFDGELAHVRGEFGVDRGTRCDRAGQHQQVRADPFDEPRDVFGRLPGVAADRLVVPVLGAPVRPAATWTVMRRVVAAVHRLIGRRAVRLDRAQRRAGLVGEQR